MLNMIYGILMPKSIYIDFTPSSPSESVRLAKQNMTDNLSITGWVVVDEKPKGKIKKYYE